MAEVLLFHHAQGQTPGFHAFADELRQAGHTVHTPDLFDGKTFGSIDERYYGRTARLFYVGVVNRPGEDPTTVHANALSVAAAESLPAHEADRLRSILRHARIPRKDAAEFWERVKVLASEFAQVPRTGDTVYGFAAGLYPTDYPTLPDPRDESTERPPQRNRRSAKS